MSEISNKDRAELNYLNVRNEITDFVDKIGYQNILRHMMEDLDHIEDMNNTRSIYLFQIISALEKILEVYPRLEQHV